MFSYPPSDWACEDEEAHSDWGIICCHVYDHEITKSPKSSLERKAREKAVLMKKPEPSKRGSSYL